MTRDEEIALVVAVLEHPAGFDLDFAGGWACIRTTGRGTIEVEWRELAPQKIYFPNKSIPPKELKYNTKVTPKEIERVESFPIESTKEAATFFINKRHELEFGRDYERA